MADDIGLAGEAPLQGAQRHHDDVVLVVPKLDLALRCEHADDLAARRS